MVFPIIRVKEKGEKGKGRIIGTNSHDLLLLDEHGNIAYQNMQDCEGTGEYSCYEFTGEKEFLSPYTTIEFVELNELLEIYKSETKSMCENEYAMIEFSKALTFRIQQIKEKSLDKDEGFRNTVGRLI